MKSKVHVKGHPLHPILVSFPIAFLVGALVFDVLGLVYDQSALNLTAQYLIIGGIGSGLLAAIPGMIDFLYTVPPESSGKKRAAKHGLINVTMIIIFTIALVMRQQGTTKLYIIILLESTGVLLMTVAGWMGGTMVYRNQIGVDVRYANAGKWKEEYRDLSDKPIDVGDTNELKVNQMKLLHIGNKRIVLGRTESGYFAFDDRCTHRGGSLAGGALICSTVQCPWHGSQFDIQNGSVKAGPAKDKITTYHTYEANGKVFLTLQH